MHLTVPSKLVCAPSYPPWLNRSLKSRIKRYNSLFKHVKSSNSPSYWSTYRSYLNSTLSYLRSLKPKFFNRLSSSPTSRHFWSSVRKLRKKPSSIPPLLSPSGSLTHSNASKANLLNDFFSRCFNTSSAPLHPNSTSTPYPCPGDLLCSDEEVLLLLLHLLSDTASGPDGISSRMLKSTAHTIAPVLTRIFNLSIQSGVFPSDWKLSFPTLFPFLNLTPLLPVLIFVLFPFSPSLVKL